VGEAMSASFRRGRFDFIVRFAWGINILLVLLQPFIVYLAVHWARSSQHSMADRFQLPIKKGKALIVNFWGNTVWQPQTRRYRGLPSWRCQSKSRS
jgi:hypothetical protein